MHKCWAVVHEAMNVPVPYMLTGCGAVGFSNSIVLHAVCLFAVRSSEMHVVEPVVCCVVPVCVNTVLPYSTYRAPHSPQPVGTETNYV